MKRISLRENIPDMYRKGMSCLDIALKVGLSRGAVYSILKVRNVRIRTNLQGLKLKYPKGRLGAQSSRWKGDKVGYGALHTWVNKIYGKPKKCQECATTKSNFFEWANVSGEYTRKRADWIRLCVPCHRNYDRKQRQLNGGKSTAKLFRKKK